MSKNLKKDICDLIQQEYSDFQLENLNVESLGIGEYQVNIVNSNYDKEKLENIYYLIESKYKYTKYRVPNRTLDKTYNCEAIIIVKFDITGDKK